MDGQRASLAVGRVMELIMSTGGSTRHIVTYVAVFLLLSGPAGGSQCEPGLPDGSSDFQLSLACLPSLLRGNLMFNGDNIQAFTDVTASIICKTPNGTERMFHFLHPSILSGGFENSSQHDLPPGSQCELAGCYTALAPFRTYAMLNASQSICTIPDLRGLTTFTVPLLSSSIPLSHSPTPLPTTSSAFSAPSNSHVQHLPTSQNGTFPTLSMKMLTSPVQTSISSQSAPFVHTLVGIAAPLLVALMVVTCLTIALLVHKLYRRKRKILKIGQDNWKTESLESNYHPLDLSKKFEPIFLSQESVINSLCNGQGCSYGTRRVDTATIPSISQHSSCISSGDLELEKNTFSDRMVQHIRLSPSRDRTQSACNTCDNSGSNYVLTSSGNTSGYDTGCYLDDTPSKHFTTNEVLQNFIKVTDSKYKSNEGIACVEERENTSDTSSHSIMEVSKDDDSVDVTSGLDHTTQGMIIVPFSHYNIRVKSSPTPNRHVQCSSDTCSSSTIAPTPHTVSYSQYRCGCDASSMNFKEQTGTTEHTFNSQPHDPPDKIQVNRSTRKERLLHRTHNIETEAETTYCKLSCGTYDDVHVGHFTTTTGAPHVNVMNQAAVKNEDGVLTATYCDIGNSLSSAKCTNLKPAVEEANKQPAMTDTVCDLAEYMIMSSQDPDHTESTSASLCISGSPADYIGYIHMESPL